MSWITPPLEAFRYAWPTEPFSARWREDGDFLARELPETREELEADSRWPGFFPSPLSVVTSGNALEKVVGASIVNRFPYVMALSFCKESLSARHHVRSTFMSELERTGKASIQFFPPGAELSAVMKIILESPEAASAARIQSSGLRTRPSLTSATPVFEDAYMVYEGRLTEPGKDHAGQPINVSPWMDVGSHRIYFIEITAIQLRSDIAAGRSQIRWRSLPSWSGGPRPRPVAETGDRVRARYAKGYNPNYAFPSPGTVAFASDDEAHGMALKHLPPLPEDQVEVDNDRARWPCFFPSSVGMITTWTPDGQPNLMPCGSTTIVSRHPLVISPCVSYAAINERYAPRASLDLLRRSGRFTCGVPFLDDAVIDAIQYSGSISIREDARKLENSGLAFSPRPWAPHLTDLPVSFECEITGEIRLGTHVMFVGEARKILVHRAVTPSAPLEWFPWAGIAPAAR